jgi:hypothetical protein
MKSLWEILVPTVMDRGLGTVPIKTRYHRVWNSIVRDIAGGLSILTPLRGHWVSPTGEVFIERMIPVRIYCTGEQIAKIAKMTAEYYNQHIVMAYKISSEVIMYER